MKDYIFKAESMSAYYDEDTVFDSMEIEFSIFDIVKYEDDLIIVKVKHGTSEYYSACFKDTLQLVREVER